MTVDNNAKCSDATYVGEAIGFTDTPVGEIRVIFTNTSGAMTAQIVCKEGTSVIPATKADGTADEDQNPDNEVTPVRDDTDGPSEAWIPASIPAPSTSIRNSAEQVRIERT